jgi:glutathione S-transferase
MLKLFYAPNACSLASHIALTEAGADFEAIRLDLKAGEQRKPDYLLINPKGRVPSISTDKGNLTENPAILNWIAETYSQAHLKPDDFFANCQMQAFNLYLCSTIHVTFAHLFRTERWADSADAVAEIRNKVPSSLASVWAVIEELLRDGRPWVCGEQFTVADPYLYVFARWLERDGVGGSAKMPLTRAHRARMQERPAVKKVLAEEDIAPV